MALGTKQINTLRKFHEPSKFKETRNGEPWDVMRSLMKRGLMWAEMREITYWHCDEWKFYRVEWWAGLTADGERALEET